MKGSLAAACLLLLLPALPAASHAASAKNRHTLVGGCFALHSDANGSYVSKGGGTYAADAGAIDGAEGFRMQATDLGTYLLYDEAEKFLAISGGLGGGGIEVADDPSPRAEWIVKKQGGSFSLKNRATGERLGVDGGGGLVADGGSTFGFERTRGCRRYPEIEVNVRGKPSTSKPDYGEVSGFLEGHMHGMAFEFLSGEAHCGKPWDRYGVTHALVDCFDHTQTEGCGAILETAVGGDTCHDTDGWPTFNGWPKPHSLTHEGLYYKWLERAHRAGLRIFVNLFVENRALCEIYPESSDPRRMKNSCDEMDSVELQSKRLHQLEDYIDAQEGGPGKGWFRIVSNPFKARKVIAAGKLAVVPGMEVSEPFGCIIRDGEPQCDRSDIDFWLDRLQKKHKVAQLEIVNKFDNALTGVAGDSGSTGVLTNSGNKQTTGRYWDLETCEDPNNTDRSPTAVEHNDDEVIANGLAALLPPGAAPVYPPGPHCNRYGLSALGEYAVRGIAKRGMVFDPDHQSVYGRNAALNVIDAVKHPGIISSHSWSTPNTLPRIARRDGIITPYAGDSESFVEKWKAVKAERRGKQYWGFGYGADMNGLGGQGDPRGADVPNPVSYPFRSHDGEQKIRRQVSGSHVYDINTEGVAHYGLYPDWIEDLRQLAGDRIVKHLGRGAEAYLQMWERSVGVPKVKCDVFHGNFSGNRGLSHQLKLGQRPKKVLFKAGQPVKRARAWRWCTRTKNKQRSNRTVVGVFDGKPKLALIASTVRNNAAGGVRRGQPGAAARRGAERMGGGLFVRRTGGGNFFVYGVRGDRVRWVGVATPKVVRNRIALRRYVKRAGLG